jgi:hypothetical protein
LLIRMQTGSLMVSLVWGYKVLGLTIHVENGCSGLDTMLQVRFIYSRVWLMLLVVMCLLYMDLIKVLCSTVGLGAQCQLHRWVVCVKTFHRESKKVRVFHLSTSSEISHLYCLLLWVY